MKVAKERKMFRNISKFIRTFNPKARLFIQENEFCFEPETQTIVIDLNEIFFVPIDEAIDKRVLKRKWFSIWYFNSNLLYFAWDSTFAIKS